jgi:hypothetical protein
MNRELKFPGAIALGSTERAWHDKIVRSRNLGKSIGSACKSRFFSLVAFNLFLDTIPNICNTVSKKASVIIDTVSPKLYLRCSVSVPLIVQICYRNTFYRLGLVQESIDSHLNSNLGL